MSHHDKLEQVLEYIINEEAEAASDLLHQIIVDKARHVYEELVDEEECMDDDEDDSIEEAEENDDEDKDDLDEDFGGDMKDDFAKDIAQNEDEIESDEMYDNADSDGDYDSGVESTDDVDDAIMCFDDKLEELSALFQDIQDRLGVESGEDDFSVDDEEPAFVGDEFDNEEEEYAEEGMYMGEATKLQDDVSVEVNGEKDAANKEAPFSKAPAKQNYGGEPTKFAKPAGEGKQVSKDAKKETVEDNIDVPEKSQSADLKGENKYSGTGRNSKKGSVQTKSPLTKRPS